MRSYGHSKLCALLFARALASRLQQQQQQMPSVVSAHPGATCTELNRHSWALVVFNAFVGMRPADGALAQVRAAVDAAARPGDFFGPPHFGRLLGAPVREQPDAAALDDAAAERLWRRSEQLIGHTFALDIDESEL